MVMLSIIVSLYAGGVCIDITWSGRVILYSKLIKTHQNKNVLIHRNFPKNVDKLIKQVEKQHYYTGIVHIHIIDLFQK